VISRIVAARRSLWLLPLALLAPFLLWRIKTPAGASSLESSVPRAAWADESRCTDCHAGHKDFSLTGHAQTLSPALDHKSLAWLRDFPTAPAPSHPLQLAISDREVMATDPASSGASQLRLDWRFGSGAHAVTWVGTLPDSFGMTDLLEFRWSWYRELNGFDITPGQPPHADDGHYGRLGVLLDFAKARMCFECHATNVPVHAGTIDEPAIRAGVTCQRCHGPQQQHVESGGKFLSGSLSRLDQLESIHRCAQCHRRAEEQNPAAITPENRALVRFQPVGLVQSPCFQGSRELTCTTCHDPHRPLAAQDSLGIWQCTQCHDGAQPRRPLCKAGRTDDCLTCHMPKVRLSAPLEFTDHWIRIRPAGEALP
jgi:hypothetical protein